MRDACQAGLQPVDVGGRDEAQHREHITRVPQGADIQIHPCNRLELAQRAFELLKPLALAGERIGDRAKLLLDLLHLQAKLLHIPHRPEIPGRRLSFIDPQRLHDDLDPALQGGILPGGFLPGTGRPGGDPLIIAVGLVEHAITAQHLGHCQQILGRDNQLDLGHLSWK